MNIPYTWLNELVEDLPPLKQLCDLLDGIGLGVEEVHHFPAAPAGVVTAKIMTAEPVEGSTKLQKCSVSDGTDSYQVICGAPNARAGMVIALAKVGAELPIGLTIGERDVMGVMSSGMICSAKELALFDYSAGIMGFAEDTPLSVELAELWQAEDVIELEVTPNRADCFSLLGVARDIATKLGTSYHHPAEGLDLGDANQEIGVSVNIESDVCDRFTLRRISDVTVAPSPIWLQRRLAHLGLRPKNNMVDVTNYVTFELGNPSHAYDLRALEDNAITVRQAQEGEPFSALNDNDYNLTAADTVISSGGKAIGAAGVMGGKHDSVREGDDSTTEIVLEVAHFQPVAVRKTSKRLGISSDASYRFERGVDPNIAPLASARILQLMQQLGGGEIQAGLLDIGNDIRLPAIDFTPSRVEFLLGIAIPLAEQQGYLERLGCTVDIVSDDHWRVVPPSWRVDMTIPEDIIDEVARLHGFEHIPKTVPHMSFVPPLNDSTQRQLKSRLAALGLTETVTYVFTSEDALAETQAPASEVQLANPQGIETSVLRTALYPNLLYASARNHQIANLALFEVGSVFQKEAEPQRVAMLLRGNWLAGSWHEKVTVDFYVLKGVLEQLAAGWGVEVRLEPAQHYSALHPNISASVYWNGMLKGFAGRVHPQIEKALELPQTFIAELELPLDASTIAFKDIPRQQHSERDLAIIAPRAVSYQELASIVQNHAGEKLEHLMPVDVYEGEQLEAGMRSVAIRMRFRDPATSLTDAELDGYMQNIVAALSEKGYSIRQ